LFPSDPWFLDEPLWSTGRQSSKGGHCYPSYPVHEGCIFEAICPRKYTEFNPSEIGMEEQTGPTGRYKVRKDVGRKTHADLIREAVENLGEATPKQIMRFIRNRHPEVDVKETSFRADIIGCSVNHTSSHHYPGMPKFLFYNKPEGTYRLFKPSTDDRSLSITGIRAGKIIQLANSLDDETVDKLNSSIRHLEYNSLNAYATIMCQYAYMQTRDL